MRFHANLAFLSKFQQRFVVLLKAVVVPKERARVAFETETRHRVDPGLVEHLRGNLYRTRIYPLPPEGERRIRLTYTTPLATAPNGDAALPLPLPRETIAKLDVRIDVTAADGTANDAAPRIGGLGETRFEKAEQRWRAEFSVENTTPEEDILVALPRLPDAFHRIERDAAGHDHFMITDLAPAAKRAAAGPVEMIHVLWDASRSRAGADLGKELALLSQLAAKTFHLTVFRDVPEPAREFHSADDLVAAVKRAPCDGGTDLAALAAALRGSDAPAGEGVRTLLFSDGFDTLSGQASAFEGISPIAIVSQPTADREALRQTCGGSLIDLRTTDPEAARAEIENPSVRVTGLRGTGVAEVQGIGQPAGGRVRLLGRLTAPEAEVRVVYADGSQSDPFVLRKSGATNGGVLSTAWAAARVNQLTPRADDFEDELLALGRTHGLVSPVTSLIVLESLDQWVRHEIEPPATLPEMCRRWRETMKRRSGGDVADQSQRLERVVALWEQRVEWWKTDFSKGVVAGNASGGVPEEEEGQAVPAARAVGRADPFAASDSSAHALRAGRSIGSSGGGGFGAVDPFASASPAEAAGGSDASRHASIKIKPWNPDTPYLETIRAAAPDARYDAYLAERENWTQSPAFFLDCAEVFYRDGHEALGRRVLTNLAEFRIEDAGLLRVLARRLRQAGDLDLAVVILRRVTGLRPEEPQSFRDLALVLAERGRGRFSASEADLEEAMRLFLRVALGDWNRHGDSTAVFALEELNALIAWIERRTWTRKWTDSEKPHIPEFDERLRANLDTDVRIVMSWDADATDIDLHVIEPGGEEAYYGHNRTRRGGLVSRDITDGYGPEEYLIHAAPDGDYAILANYYGSRQQTVVGPATITATVFTNWARADEARRTLTVRLDEPKEKVEVGTITFTRGESGAAPADLELGMSRDQVISLLGEPEDADATPLRYPSPSKTLRVFFDDDGALIRVTETLPGGAETLILQ